MPDLPTIKSVTLIDLGGNEVTVSPTGLLQYGLTVVESNRDMIGTLKEIRDEVQLLREAYCRETGQILVKR